MTHAKYRRRIPVHEDRTGARKSTPNRLIVLHTSEGGETGAAAANLAGFLTRPGDRTTSAGGRFGASYHVVLDVESAIPAVPYDVVAYAAAGANHDGIHLCFPGRAGQSREQWLDPISRGMIRTAAAVIVDVSELEGIPARFLTVAAIKAGAAGVCDHEDISNAFGRSTHWDVGPSFPWDVLAADIADFINPPTPEDPDMLNLIRLVRPAGYANVFAATPFGSRHLGEQTYRAMIDAGVDPTIIDTDHPQEIAALLAQSGLSRSDLVRL